MCSRCLWDADTDNYAEDVFMNVGAFVLITLVIGGGGLTSQRQFRFNSLCFNKTYSPCFHFIGQLVLCGGSFWELLLLRMTRWMTEIFQMEGSLMLAKNAKPNFSQSQASEMVQRVFRLTPAEIRPLPSYDDQNFYLATVEGGEYVLKIMNSEDSKNHKLIEMQTYAMSFLHQNGLPAQTALPTASGQLMSLEEMDCGYGCQKYMVRVLNHLPGTTVSKVPLTPQLLYDIGKTAARMDKILKEMAHPELSALQRDKFIWSLSNVTLLEGYLNVLDGDPLQQVIKSVIHLYKSSVVAKYPNFRKCINHGDFNDLNVLVQPDESDGHRITGILDFGDLNSGYYIHELAITIMYMMMEHPNPIEVGGLVLAGWESVLPLNEEEKECLFVLVLSRFCQSLILARYFVTLHPENEEYLMISSRKGVGILRQVWELGKEQVEKVWFQSAAQFSDRQ
uniref:Hydroxylysine kinase n=2 Tax=Scophthalmus maximus TaxID=52904 RepID=A0A8D3E6X4_SCOMX